MTLTTEAQTATTARVRRRFVVRGLVQGVGFRPFVYVTASELGLSGCVANDSGGVVVEVEGEPGRVGEFDRRLRESPPPMAVVVEVAATDVAVRGGTGFRIAGSSRADGARTFASPDLATCDHCLRELADPADRRHRHPFITCTNCGPRFTIITDLPYDRAATTMAGFAMCAQCEREYADPGDRRFHAQPIACPGCGPRLELVCPDGTRRHDEAGLREARALLASGAVLAVKGIGGYHLACDAGDERAVAELRRRKRRGAKPFAVLVRDLAAARALTCVDDREAALLTGPQRPIVLLRRRATPAVPSVAADVAPGNPDLGLLLPYTPLHTLLLGLPGDAPGPAALVMTSGNLGGEPIAYDDADAQTRLAPLADAWLRHDRPIRVPCDDSVTRVVDDAELPIRRSRGHAPLPIALPTPVPATLATGADLKNTCCLAEGGYAWVSQHVGDMDDLATGQAFGSTQAHLQRLTGVRPGRLVADAHPGYRSTGWARRHADGRPLQTVQHHHAHVAAVMAEHGLDGGRPVLGFAFDGTGYGTDGAVWGGELLVADYAGFERFAQLRYTPLPGGDASVLRPYRMALAHLAAAGLSWDDDLPPVAACPPRERDLLAQQLRTGFGCVPTSSMGRLFDAVASLAGVRHRVDYEAQAAIELEALSRPYAGDDPGYRFGWGRPDPGGPWMADPSPVLSAVVADIRAGVRPGVVGARFHDAVVALVTAGSRRGRDELGLEEVVLTGGVFQNALLLSAARRALRREGFGVLTPHRLPPNDGGLAVGQVMVAATVRGRQEEGSCA